MKQPRLNKREMRLWLNTFGACHELMCKSGKGWAWCECILAVALREFDKISIRKQSGAKPGASKP